MHDWILGVGASHNGGAALLRDGRLVVAIQEERLRREKRARLRPAFDALAIRYCLDAAGITVSDLAAIGLCRDEPLEAPESDLTRNALFEGTDPERLVHVSHHRAHAAAAAFQSGFEQAAVLVIDGLGSPLADCEPQEREQAGKDGWETVTIYRFVEGDGLTCVHKEVARDKAWLSHSAEGMPRFGGIGGMYSAVSHQIFGAYLEAGKVMGLAPYGKPSIESWKFWRSAGETLTFSTHVPDMYVSTKRWPALQREYEDLAASAQVALEEAVLWAATKAHHTTGSRNLAYAGGVALNCPANERLLHETPFEDVFVMPAAEDSGTAIGAAVCAAWTIGLPLVRESLRRDSTGVRWPPHEVDDEIKHNPVVRRTRRATTPELVAKSLADGDRLGWYTEGSELGPRALGCRSVLADPRDPEANRDVNRRKGREQFRPLAPVVLREHASDWFELGATEESPFMLRVAAVRSDKRDEIPAVVHVDGSARVQTLEREQGPHLHAVLEAFYSLTGVPVLINTSFNAAGEPIVETPHDALWCAYALHLDAVVFDDHMVEVEADLDVDAVELAVRPHTVRRRAIGAKGDRVELEIETRWGPARYWVQGEELSLLRLLTEDRTRLSAALEFGDWSSVEELRRKRIVELSRVPSVVRGGRDRGQSAPQATLPR